jgi:CheY-like chemotaxis protein
MTVSSILIIDDNETDRYLLKRLIKAGNISNKIFESENGRAALDFLEENIKANGGKPDGFPPMLIFLDINMPIMGGFEFLEEFTKLVSDTKGLESTVLTMFSSSEKEEDKERALSYDMVKGYMVKLPRSADELKNVLRDHFPEL